MTESRGISDRVRSLLRSPQFHAAEAAAERFAQSPGTLGALARGALSTTQQLRKPATLSRLNSILGRDDVQTYLAEVRTLVRLVDAYRKGEYRDIDRADLSKIVAGLVYLVTPVDVIPDFLGPAAGFVDDLLLLRWIIRRLRTEIRRFEEWERGEGPNVVRLT